MIARRSIAVVIGASGGIGRALAEALCDAGFARVVGLSRSGVSTGCDSMGGVEAGRIDLDDEASVCAAAARVASDAAASGLATRLVVVATGMLHGDGVSPEKRLSAIDPAAMAAVYRANAIGPAIAAKHFVPLLAGSGRAVFAALSARVGSVSDNRSGGWHSYRASKAALNMIVRGVSIELSRTRPEALCLALHPGTVATGLSAPFGRGLPEGQVVSPERAAARLLAVLDGAGMERNGACLAWDGSVVPP